MSLILDLIFPKTCYVCARSGCYLCPSCYPALNPKSIQNTSGTEFEGRLSLFHYKDSIQSILYDLKYQYVTDLVSDLSNLIVFHLNDSFPHLLAHWQEHQYCLVPIPLHSHRLNWRGFNQSEIIAQNLSEKLKLPITTELLAKTDNTKPQAQLNRSSRHTSPQAFRLNANKPTRPTNIILFDDVYTTGSTIKAAASCFDKNISNIWVLTLAG